MQNIEYFGSIPDAAAASSNASVSGNNFDIYQVGGGIYAGWTIPSFLRRCSFNKKLKNEVYYYV
jgi:hypothetical protein